MENIIKDKLNERWNPAQGQSHLAISKDLLLEYLVSAFMGIVIGGLKTISLFLRMKLHLSLAEWLPMGI